MKTLKQFFFNLFILHLIRGYWSLYYYLRDEHPLFFIRLRDFFLGLIYKPIYYSYFSRDCDMYETSYVDVFRAGRKAFLKMQEMASEWAEGPKSWTPISKEEYEAEKGMVYHRDRAMEAFENGMGRSIYV